MGKDDGGLFFPGMRDEKLEQKYTGYPTVVSVTYPGISKREWYAGMVLQGICASEHISNSVEQRKEIGRRAFSYADEMIAESKKD